MSTSNEKNFTFRKV